MDTNQLSYHNKGYTQEEFQNLETIKPKYVQKATDEKQSSSKYSRHLRTFDCCLKIACCCSFHKLKIQPDIENHDDTTDHRTETSHKIQSSESSSSPITNKDLLYTQCKEKVICMNVRHVQQQYSWDCGVACVSMVLPFVQYSYLENNIKKISIEEGYLDSTWTIDLAYLLRKFNVPFRYSTITTGVDPELAKETFYEKFISKDERRVEDRFKQASTNGIEIKKECVSLVSIIQHISMNLPLLLLTNANLLNCLICNKSGKFLKRKTKSAYIGHFIVLTGYDMLEKLVYYNDPAVKTHMCHTSFHDMQMSRLSYGTDEDVIFIDHVDIL